MKNEKLTRKEIIDNRLKQAGWNVTDRTQVIEEFDIQLTIVEEPITPYTGSKANSKFREATKPLTKPNCVGVFSNTSLLMKC